MIRTILLSLAGVFACLAAIGVARTLALPAPGDASGAPAPPAYDGAAERLAVSIRIRTISNQDAASDDAGAFALFADFLKTAYPAVHERAEREIVNGGAVILRIPGADPALAPIALIAHSDVVPVEPQTEPEWTHPPFAGVVADGMVWGRGALDNKGQLIAIMEAAESLLRDGFTPQRDVYLLFGHDEEVGGEDGAAAIAARLKAKGVRFAFTLDEGSGVVSGVVRGAANPIALIATAEKGSTSLRFRARAHGGHSSTPGPETAVSLAARAVLAVSDAPYPLEFDANVRAFLRGLAPELPFAQRLALANLWLFGPVVKTMLARDPVTAAAMRTTTAPTMIEGGVKINVLPQTADAYVNYRIHPRDCAEAVLRRAVRQIDDPRIEVEALGAAEPSPQSSTASEGYARIAATTRAVFGSIAVAPSLTLQGTDTRNYAAADMADDYYRFTPFLYETEDLSRIHGTDERISIAVLHRAIAWYETFLRNAAG